MFRKISRLLSKVPPPRILVLGYLTYSLIGWLVLSMPVCHRDSVPLIDNLFVSTSALSTTGLSTVDLNSSYSLFGQIIILLLVQMGGIGYMTFSSFVILTTTQQLSSRRQEIVATNFPLPKGFSTREFLVHAILYTFVCELVGAIALSAIFVHKGVEDALWSGIFHSVSAFSTAGFSLFTNSFIDFRYNFWVNFILSGLCVLGALGFIVWLDLYKRFTKQKDHLTFTTKVIISLTFSFLIIGSAIFFFTSPPPPDATTFYHKAITAWFQVMSASATAGFNTLDIGHLTEGSLVLLIFLMVFGASPAGTGGGLKNTTFAALLGLIKSVLTSRQTVSFWHRKIPTKRLRLATATFAYYSFVMAIFVFLLILAENKQFLPLIFEAASAIGTVGLSMGITADLTDLGKILISLLMFIGRIGVLTFGIALSVGREEAEHYVEDKELVF